MNAPAAEVHPPAGQLQADPPAVNPMSREDARARLAEIAASLGAPKQQQPTPRQQAHRKAIAKFLLHAFAKTAEEIT